MVSLPDKKQNSNNWVSWPLYMTNVEIWNSYIVIEKKNSIFEDVFSELLNHSNDSFIPFGMLGAVSFTLL